MDSSRQSESQGNGARWCHRAGDRPQTQTQHGGDIPARVALGRFPPASVTYSVGVAGNRAAISRTIRPSRVRSRRKLYSFGAPEGECIGKGKASAPYEFGVKVSVLTTNARAPGGQFVPGASR